ncbi:MAG: ribosome small subunit-dependent GTPase A [Polyangiales bacterium]
MTNSRTQHGIVVLQTGGFVDVRLEDGSVVRCRLRGRLKKERVKTDLCVIGDRVEILPNEEGPSTVESIEPRRTKFSRTHPARGARLVEDVLVANLDVLVVCFGYGSAIHPRMLDRFLVIAEHNHIVPVIVANKCDREEAEYQRELFEPYTELGYEVIETSTRTDEGIEELRDRLRGRIAAFSGPSGAGKSSLVNRMIPGLDLRVGEINELDGKGRHTTRVATLHALPDGGFVADTPGIRELGTWDLPPSELDRCFREIAEVRDGCQFRDCVHVEEPGCAVKAAVDDGRIREERYDSYLRMLDDEERPERVG